MVGLWPPLGNALECCETVESVLLVGVPPWDSALRLSTYGAQEKRQSRAFIVFFYITIYRHTQGFTGEPENLKKIFLAEGPMIFIIDFWRLVALRF